MGTSLILEKGIIPNLTFYGEEYKLNDKPYTHTQLSRFFHKYVPNSPEIYEYFKQNNISHHHIFSRSKESIKIYNEAIFDIRNNVCESDYQKHLWSVIRKLYYLGNREDAIYNAITQLNVVDELILFFLIDECKKMILEKPYIPQKK